MPTGHTAEGKVRFEVEHEVYKHPLVDIQNGIITYTLHAYKLEVSTKHIWYSGACSAKLYTDEANTGA